MAQELNFGTGIVHYNINGACDISFNPTDSVFIERLFDVFETLDKRQDRYKTEMSGEKSFREVFDVMRKTDAETRDLVNGLFEADVCTPLFGAMNVFAEADGFPVWSNFLLCIMDVINDAMNGIGKRSDARIAKYTAKYRKK